MHNSADYIGDKVVENLNRLASHKQINKFRESLNNLSRDHKQCYCCIITVKGHASTMASILNAVKKYEAINIFNGLLQKNKDFAFKTLDSIANHNFMTLFKTLFGQLNQYKEEYIKYVMENQKSSSAMIYILTEMRKQEVVSTLHDLFKKSQDFARYVLEVEDYRVCFETEPTITTPFQDEFSELSSSANFSINLTMLEESDSPESELTSQGISLESYQLLQIIPTPKNK